MFHQLIKLALIKYISIKIIKCQLIWLKTWFLMTLKYMLKGKDTLTQSQFVALDHMLTNPVKSLLPVWDCLHLSCCKEQHLETLWTWTEAGSVGHWRCWDHLFGAPPGGQADEIPVRWRRRKNSVVEAWVLQDKILSRVGLINKYSNDTINYLTNTAAT